MARPRDPRTTAALALLRQGWGLRAAAKHHGLAPSTLVRAAQADGITLPRGRRPKQDPGASESPGA